MFIILMEFLKMLSCGSNMYFSNFCEVKCLFVLVIWIFPPDL